MQLMRRLLLYFVIVVVIVGITACGGSSSVNTGTVVTSTATSGTTPTPTQGVTMTPTPTNTPLPILSVTHGTPRLGGPISDFYGKYGSQIIGNIDTISDPNGKPAASVGWVTDSSNAYFLSVHYYTPSNTVYYLTYSGPTDWSKAQYRDFMLTFAPPGTQENTQANLDWQNSGGDPFNPIAYTSDIGNFFIHINAGVADMNTV